MPKTLIAAFLFSCLFVKAQDTVKIALNVSPDELAEQDYNRGLLALQNNDLPGSVAFLSKSIETKPNFDKAFSNRAVAYTRQKKFQEAISDINQAIAINPQNPEYYFSKSLIFFNMSSRDSQNVALDSCLKLKGDHADAAYYKGLLSFEAKDYDRAIAFYSQAISSRPGFAYAFNDRASAKLAKDSLEGAISDYEAAVSFDSSMAFAYNNLGSAYRSKKLYDKALGAYNKALSRDAGYLIALLNRGNTYFELGDLKSAQKDFEEALSVSPKNSFAYNNLASIAIKNKDYKKAKDLASRSIELDVKNGPAYYNRGIARQMLHDEDGSCTDWKKALSLGVEGAKAFINVSCLD